MSSRDQSHAVGSVPFTIIVTVAPVVNVSKVNVTPSLSAFDKTEYEYKPYFALVDVRPTVVPASAE